MPLIAESEILQIGNGGPGTQPRMDLDKYPSIACASLAAMRDHTRGNRGDAKPAPEMQFGSEAPLGNKGLGRAV